MKRLVVIGLTVLSLVGCCKQRVVEHAEEQMVAVDSTMDAIQDSAYLESLVPVQAALNEQLDVKLGYAPKDLRVYSPECEMLNWASDALYDMAVEVVGKDRTVDFAVVNIGGMRTEWQAGDITRRSVFELMPFDNELVILTLTGDKVLALADVFAQWGGQGVSRQFRMEMKNKKAQNVRLHGKPIEPTAVYYVATSDYLAGGTDHMTPLAEHLEMLDTDQKIRDLYMRRVQEQGTVTAEVDGRMKLL